MKKSLVNFCYKQIVEHNTADVFGKHVFNATYNEFLLKSQAYNPGGSFSTFTKLKANDGRANSLHYKCGFAIAGLMDSLNKMIPMLTDQPGNCLAFDTWKLKIIESNIHDNTAHKVAIYYYSGIHTLLATAGEYLLLARGDHSATLPGIAIDTFLLKVPQHFSITTYQEVLHTQVPL